MPEQPPSLTKLVFVDAQGRYLGTFLGPSDMNYQRVYEWAQAERGAVTPQDLMPILRADKRFWSVKAKLVRIE